MSAIYVDEILPSTNQYLKITQNGITSPLYAKEIGEIIQLRTRKTTSVAFPYFLLSSPDTILDSSNYPDYVEYLRNVKVETFASTVQTPTATVSGTTMTLSVSTALTLGSLIYFHIIGSSPSGQFRTILSGSGTSYTLDDPITLGSATAFSIMDPTTFNSNFSGSWSSSEFTFTNTIASNRIVFEALLEDALYSGALPTIASTTTTWTLPSIALNNTYGLGIIRANGVDLIITSIKHNTSGDVRSITTNSAGSGSSIEIFPNRTATSTIARHKQIDDSVLINNGMQVVSGLRIRDRLQGHRHSVSHNAKNLGTNAPTGGGVPYYPVNASITILDPIADGTNGTPRTGQFTRPRGLGVYFYEYMGRVTT